MRMCGVVAGTSCGKVTWTVDSLHMHFVRLVLRATEDSLVAGEVVLRAA